MKLFFSRDTKSLVAFGRVWSRVWSRVVAVAHRKSSPHMKNLLIKKKTNRKPTRNLLFQKCNTAKYYDQICIMYTISIFKVYCRFSCGTSCGTSFKRLDLESITRIAVKEESHIHVLSQPLIILLFTKRHDTN